MENHGSEQKRARLACWGGWPAEPFTVKNWCFPCWGLGRRMGAIDYLRFTVSDAPSDGFGPRVREPRGRLGRRQLNEALWNCIPRAKAVLFSDQFTKNAQ